MLDLFFIIECAIGIDDVWFVVYCLIACSIYDDVVAVGDDRNVSSDDMFANADDTNNYYDDLIANYDDWLASEENTLASTDDT